MIEYEFDQQFYDAIAKGEKRATLRKMRIRPRRHAREGERIECWSWVNGLRLQIRAAECAGVDGVFMELGQGVFRLGPIIHNRSTWPDLDAGGREGLARLTGFTGGWAEAARYYEATYGAEPWTGCLVTWRDLEYTGPLPSVPQLRDLAILTQHARVIPCYGKVSPAVAHSLLVLGWAEVCDRSETFRPADRRGTVPIRITDKGRWILDRFGK